MSGRTALDAEHFLRDVASHQMEVLRDDGTHRHLRFQAPGSTDMHFDLITWPGYLCFTGDMGTYVFRRLKDMFNFFRPADDACSSRDPLENIDHQNWAEKLEATDKGDGHSDFDPRAFKREIAKQHLVPKVMKNHGLKPGEFELSDDERVALACRVGIELRKALAFVHGRISIPKESRDAALAGGAAGAPSSHCRICSSNA